MKTFPVWSLLFFLAHHQMHAQIVDDFSDGDFTANPSWYGTTANFIVNASGQLQLNASAAGKSWMYTDFLITPDQRTVWEFYVKQSFSPSGANYSRFYLMSDETDLSGALNGYFLQFGEAGSDDAIELFRQSGTALSSVCRASAAAIASAFSVRVRVIRENNRDWQVLIAYDGTNAFQAEASGTDGEHQTARFAGPLCTYTISNATRFYFDDFHFSSENVSDRLKPGVISTEVINSRKVLVTFTEHMDSASVSDPQMYFVRELSLHPEAIEQQTDIRAVTLSFGHDFRNGYQHTLEIHGVTDLAGNALRDTTVAFLFFQAYPVYFKDIILSEILPDPSPPVGLPEAEYVELLNRSSHPVDLAGWNISDEKASVKLDRFILVPGAYLVLTNAAEKFDGFGNVMDVPLPSLNNSGDLIRLRDPRGLIVDSLAYADSWFSDDAIDGGWSLELIDPENTCAGARNWTVSESTSGGTPASDNSVKATLPDNRGPVVLSVVPLDSLTVQIYWDEALAAEVPSVEHFQIEPFTEILTVLMDASRTRIMLTLATPLERGQLYTITLRDIYDCSGNPLQQGTFSTQLVIPEEAKAGDIVINEILFNPMPQGVDFVELFNCSDKVIDPSNWLLANAQNASIVVLPVSLSVMYPGEYRVFTEDVDILKGEYIAGQANVFRQSKLPDMNDDEGKLVLRDDSGRMIDSVLYSEDYHNPFVRDGEGISLERISAVSPGIDKSNWRSASAETGFATPGYVNSNTRTGAVSGESVTIQPEVIQPDAHLLSFALIQYQFDDGGLMANVRVVDQQGRAIREIVSNELLGRQGFFRWDADHDNGSAAGMGYYMVLFEVFDAHGMVAVIRKRIAIF